MALTTTTLSAATADSDTSFTVGSATGVAAGYIWRCDDEMGYVAQTYISGTAIPVLRAKNGTAALAHVSGANIVFGTAADWALPNAAVTVAYPLAGRRRKLVSYSASGAITLPSGEEDLDVILNGTSVLAMTVAAPGKDLDGAQMTIMSNGVAAHTITFTGGLSGAGTNYDVITVNASAPIAITVKACNGLWIVPVAPAITGTVTNITGGVA